MWISVIFSRLLCSAMRQQVVTLECCAPSVLVACESPFEPVNSVIESIPLCLISCVPLCLMSIEEQSLHQDGSLPHPTCSTTLLCSPPAVGGAVSWCAPWADVGCSDGAVGRSSSSCEQLPSNSLPTLSLIPVLFHFHWRLLEGFLSHFKEDHFGLAQQFLWCALLACSAIAGGGVIISSAFLRAKLWGSDLPLKPRLVFWSGKL